ncbi:polysaccharide deacetylase domain protein [Salmonella enterica subsp. enterica]|nr:polysaccharide deacetylase domain protein [Salmonella enterica subsp. enterica]
MVMRVVLILLFFFSGNVLAALPARYMQTTKDAAIWSQIGDKMVTVGNIRAGQILSVTPVAADYYAFKFGFGEGLSIKAIWNLCRENKKWKMAWAILTSRSAIRIW